MPGRRAGRGRDTDRVLRGWQGRTGAGMLSLGGVPRGQRRDIMQLLTLHQAAVTGVAFSPDGSLLASACSDGWVHLWRLPAGEHLFGLEIDPFPISVAFAPDGSALAVAGGGLGVLNLEERAWRVVQAGGRHRELAFQPDGRVLTGADRQLT